MSALIHYTRSEMFQKKFLFMKLKKDAISYDIVYFYNNIDGK